MKKNTANYFSAIAGFILLIIGLILLKVMDNPQGIMRTLPYLCVGIGCGIFGGGMGNILGEKAFKKHPELKKQKEIEEKDERNVSIANQSKARAYDMMVFVFGAIMCSFALMNVELRAILLLICAYLFVIGYGVFYRFRLEKEL